MTLTSVNLGGGGRFSELLGAFFALSVTLGAIGGTTLQIYTLSKTISVEIRTISAQIAEMDVLISEMKEQQRLGLENQEAIWQTTNLNGGVMIDIREELINQGMETHSFQNNVSSQIASIRKLQIGIETSTSAIVTEQTSINGQFVTLRQQITNIGAKQDTQVQTGSSILATLEEIATSVKVPLITRMNEAVNKIGYLGNTAVQFDGDACEYDPLGFGPINCNGIEVEKGHLRDITFSRVL